MHSLGRSRLETNSGVHILVQFGIRLRAGGWTIRRGLASPRTDGGGGDLCSSATKSTTTRPWLAKPSSTTPFMPNLGVSSARNPGCRDPHKRRRGRYRACRIQRRRAKPPPETAVAPSYVDRPKSSTSSWFGNNAVRPPNGPQGREYQCARKQVGGRSAATPGVPLERGRSVQGRTDFPGPQGLQKAQDRVRRSCR